MATDQAAPLTTHLRWAISHARITHSRPMAVSQVRKEEIKLLSKTAVVKTMNLCLVFAVPPVIALVIFATYVFNKGPFDSVFSFTVLSLFNTLRFPLVVLPKALRGTSGACVNALVLPHVMCHATSCAMCQSAKEGSMRVAGPRPGQGRAGRRLAMWCRGS